MSNKSIKKIKILSSIFALIILILFIFSLINYSVLSNQVDESLNNQVEKYGYIGVFILAFILEISPQPFASALVPYANGIIFGLDFKLLLAITILAVILSSLTAYWIGLKYGKRVAIKFTGEETYQKYHNIFKKYGKPGMAILALTPIPYFPILAGLFKMNLKNFIIFAVIPRIFHFLVFGYLINVIF